MAGAHAPNADGKAVRVVITVPWDERQIQRIRAAFPFADFRIALQEADIRRAIGEAEVVFGDISREAFLQARDLRWIQCHGAGVNKLVAIPELMKSDVQVTTTSGAHAATIAEHFFGMLFSLTRRLSELHQAQLRGEWINWGDWTDRIGVLPVSVKGMTLGIIGFGNVGRAIADRAVAFQMNIVAVDICDKPRPPYLADLWGLEDLPQLMRQSDVVVVSLPGTPETTGLLSRELLSLMKPTAYFGVVSRGGIVDEEAIADLLVEHRLAGAVIDVAKAEPLPEKSPLWKAPNLILTPHCSGKSEQTTAAATSIFIENLQDYLAGNPLKNLVDKKLGF